MTPKPYLHLLPHNLSHLSLMSGWPRRLVLPTASILLIVLTFTFLHQLSPNTLTTSSNLADLEPPQPSTSPPPPPGPPHPRYKPIQNITYIPIADNFPLACTAHSRDDLPPIPTWNTPPSPHVSEATPLFIGFTRNWPLLQQAVVSYITSGWPAEDIYVIDNTGVMHSNRLGLLTLQNPSYLNYTRLETLFGVNVLTAPTLLTFAQLQNFYLFTALERSWTTYFWSHMDVVALPDENFSPFTTLYDRAVSTLRSTTSSPEKWGARFFAYDRLALVNVAAYTAVGGWDTMIPFYGTDCDMHERLEMEGYGITDAVNGFIYDVGGSLPDLLALYRQDTPRAAESCREDAEEEKKAFGRGDCRYDALIRACDELQIAKNTRQGGRNYWQVAQRGGGGQGAESDLFGEDESDVEASRKPEPFYRDADGFEKAIEMTIESGRQIMREKWGHDGCGLRGAGLDTGDAWRVLGEWEE